MWEGVRGRGDEKLRGGEFEKPIEKEIKPRRGTALGMNLMMRGGSSHYKAMRRLVGGEAAMKPDFESMGSEVEAME